MAELERAPFAYLKPFLYHAFTMQSFQAIISEMRSLKLLVKAFGLTGLHLGILKLTFIVQGLPYMFWVGLAPRVLLILLAALPLAARAVISIKTGFVLPSPLVFFAYYLVLLWLFPKLQELWKAVTGHPRVGRRALLLGSGVVALGAVGVSESSRNLTVVEHELPLADLSVEHEGLKVALLADLHRGPAVGRSYLEEVVARVNELKPDLIVMPGDFVSKSPSYFEDLETILANLNPRIASLATLGNHDHWEGADKALETLQAAGVLALQNRALYLGPQKTLTETPEPGSLCLAGVDDLWYGQPDFGFFQKVPRELPVLLLSHHPDVAEEFGTVACRVDLQLSGHTHGGQVVLPGVGALATASAYGTKYLYGWCQGPSWPVFTTCGIGTSTLPVRVGTQAEIVLFTLNRKALNEKRPSSPQSGQEGLMS